MTVYFYFLKNITMMLYILPVYIILQVILRNPSTHYSTFTLKNQKFKCIFFHLSDPNVTSTNSSFMWVALMLSTSCLPTESVMGQMSVCLPEPPEVSLDWTLMHDTSIWQASHLLMSCHQNTPWCLWPWRYFDGINPNGQLQFEEGELVYITACSGLIFSMSADIHIFKLLSLRPRPSWFHLNYSSIEISAWVL